MSFMCNPWTHTSDYMRVAHSDDGRTTPFMIAIKPYIIGDGALGLEPQLMKSYDAAIFPHQKLFNCALISHSLLVLYSTLRI